MNRNGYFRSLTLAAGVLAAGACQKAPSAPAAAGPQTATTSTSSTTSTTTTTTTAAAPAPPLDKAKVCALLSAAEVTAIMGKPLVQHPGSCSYELDSSDREAAAAKAQKDYDAASRGGDTRAMMQSMASFGKQRQKKGIGMLDQLEVTVDAHRDDESEEAVKAIYAKTGSIVRGATAPLAPEQRGLNGLIEGMDELHGVGDWAFSTNVASVNMGMGFSVRGRLLEARKGPWHITVSTTISPDPGVAKLNDQMSQIARALITKLDQS